MNAPTRIGRYEIIRRLSKSMTEVYLAMDTVENRKVALKLIAARRRPRHALIVEAERRGAAIQKELHHLDPRMVEIYEYGDLDGYFFVAMEFVEGRTVADVLASDHVVDPYRAAVIALEICEQLSKFHSWESAVVHGDIKPSNIHLSSSDTVRLLDFGIAKMLRVDCNATEHQFGSPSYCSPERLTRAEVDPHSDLWALGATLYEMLAGVPPYQAEDTRKLEGLIQSKRPPRALPASCPAGLARHRHEVAGAGRRQAVPVGGRVPAGPAALSGAEADAGGDRSGGRRGIRPRPWRRRARPFVASRVRRGASRGAGCRSWARRRTSPPECCSGSAARSAGSCGRHAPARRPAPR